MKKSIWSSVFVVVLTIGLVLSLSLSVQAKMAWKMALGDAPGAAQWEVGKTFADKMAEYTKGELEVQLFPTSQLGSEQETVQNCRLGTLDLSVIAIIRTPAAFMVDSTSSSPIGPSARVLACSALNIM